MYTIEKGTGAVEISWKHRDGINIPEIQLGVRFKASCTLDLPSLFKSFIPSFFLSRISKSSTYGEEQTVLEQR